MEASWKRYFTPVTTSSLTTQNSQPKISGFSSNWSSHLPEVYAGMPNRIERYAQYDQMDLDSHIKSSLDIISEFCTEVNEDTGLPFRIEFCNEITDTPTKSEVALLSNLLKKWITLNNFDNRLFPIIRNIIKYGDQVFVRDPETYEWLVVQPTDVESILVNEGKGKSPEVYRIRNFDYNKAGQVVSPAKSSYTGSMPGVASTAYTAPQVVANTNGSRFNKSSIALDIDANHIVHLSMNNGLEPNWPFGCSILESIYKTYKQKELLEDSIIIYRVQRAPERRVFYIDVGELPEQKAMAFVERMKNEIHQRRIPTKNGGGSSMMDASYSPLSVLEDFFFPQKSDGRGSKVETLPGGDTSWGLDELQYFDNKLARGLRVPSSYLPTGQEDSSMPFTDGRTGTAMMQELRFAKYCERIQNSVVNVFDREFKAYLKKRGVTISAGMFKLKFVKPQNFGVWRKIEIDSAKISNFIQMSNIPYISKRVALEQYLGWSEAQITENVVKFIQENPKKFENSKLHGLVGTTNDQTPDLRDVGIRPTDMNLVSGESADEISAFVEPSSESQVSEPTVQEPPKGNI